MFVHSYICNFSTAVKGYIINSNATLQLVSVFIYLSNCIQITSTLQLGNVCTYVCLSVCPSIRPSVRPSVRPSLGWSVVFCSELALAFPVSVSRNDVGNIRASDRAYEHIGQFRSNLARCTFFGSLHFIASSAIWHGTFGLRIWRTE